MKTKSLLLFAAASLLLAACGSSDEGWKTDDFEFIPLENEEGLLQYVDVSENKVTGWGNFEKASLFSDGLALVQREDEDDTYIYIDKKGKQVGSTVYRSATVFHDGMAWVAEPAGPLKVIDTKGKTLFEFKEAEQAFPFHEGVAAFCNAEGKWGLVNKKGEVIVTPRWSRLVPMVVDGLIVVEDSDSGWCLSDTEGNVLSSYYEEVLSNIDLDDVFLTNYVQAMHEGRIPVWKGKWGIIDKEGTVVINPQFSEIQLDGDLYLFRKGSKYGWCDKDGQYVINPQFEDAHPFAGSELAAVEGEDGWGFVDREGKWVINQQFGDAMPFIKSFGLAPVEDDDSGDWGLIDKTGKWVVNPQFRGIQDMTIPGMIAVGDQAGCVGFIGKDGKYLVSPNYDDLVYDMVINIEGLRDPCQARSDYVDIEAYAGKIAQQLRSLKTATAGKLLQIYDLDESDFSKWGGTTTLSSEDPMSDMTIRIKTSAKVWNATSVGWYGYNYTFMSDVRVDEYVVTVDFSYGRARRFVEEIFEALKKEFSYDQNNGMFSVPGCSSVTGKAIPGDGMTFHVKTA